MLCSVCAEMRRNHLFTINFGVNSAWTMRELIAPFQFATGVPNLSLLAPMILSNPELFHL